jgi:hypothetical protein
MDQYLVVWSGSVLLSKPSRQRIERYRLTKEVNLKDRNVSENLAEFVGDEVQGSIPSIDVSQISIADFLEMASQFDLVFNALNGFRSGTRGQICFGWGDQCGIGWPQGQGDDHDPQHNYRRSHVESQKREIKVIAQICSS